MGCSAARHKRTASRIAQRAPQTAQTQVYLLSGFENCVDRQRGALNKTVCRGLYPADLTFINGTFAYDITSAGVDASGK